MDSLEDLLGAGSAGGALSFGPVALLTSLLVAFFVGQGIAWVYTWTHSGLSYSRGFTQSVVLLTMVSALVMYVIGDSVVTAFGLIGALAIIRFRNVLKDTRDTVFVFYSLLLGMAIGSQRYLNALLAATVLMAATAYLSYTRFGSKGQYDGHLTARLARDGAEAVLESLNAVLGAFCRRTRQLTIHDAGEGLEYVFEVRLRDRRRGAEMVDTLKGLGGMGNVAFVQHDDLEEM